MYALVLYSRTGYGPFFTQEWVCTLAAINHTTAHMHGHHEATSGLSWLGLRRNLSELCTCSRVKLTT